MSYNYSSYNPNSSNHGGFTYSPSTRGQAASSPTNIDTNYDADDVDVNGMTAASIIDHLMNKVDEQNIYIEQLENELANARTQPPTLSFIATDTTSMKKKLHTPIRYHDLMSLNEQKLLQSAADTSNLYMSPSQKMSIATITATESKCKSLEAQLESTKIKLKSILHCQKLDNIPIESLLQHQDSQQYDPFSFDDNNTSPFKLLNKDSSNTPRKLSSSGLLPNKNQKQGMNSNLSSVSVVITVYKNEIKKLKKQLLELEKQIESNKDKEAVSDKRFHDLEASLSDRSNELMLSGHNQLIATVAAMRRDMRTFHDDLVGDNTTNSSMHAYESQVQPSSDSIRRGSSETEVLLSYVASDKEKCNQLNQTITSLNASLTSTQELLQKSMHSLQVSEELLSRERHHISVLEEKLSSFQELQNEVVTLNLTNTNYMLDNESLLKTVTSLTQMNKELQFDMQDKKEMIVSLQQQQQQQPQLQHQVSILKEDMKGMRQERIQLLSKLSALRAAADSIGSISQDLKAFAYGDYSWIEANSNALQSMDVDLYKHIHTLYVDYTSVKESYMSLSDDYKCRESDLDSLRVECMNVAASLQEQRLQAEIASDRALQYQQQLQQATDSTLLLGKIRQELLVIDGIALCSSDSFSRADNDNSAILVQCMNEIRQLCDMHAIAHTPTPTHTSKKLSKGSNDVSMLNKRMFMYQVNLQYASDLAEKQNALVMLMQDKLAGLTIELDAATDQCVRVRELLVKTMDDAMIDTNMLPLDYTDADLDVLLQHLIDAVMPSYRQQKNVDTRGSVAAVPVINPYDRGTHADYDNDYISRLSLSAIKSRSNIHASALSPSSTTSSPSHRNDTYSPIQQLRVHQTHDNINSSSLLSLSPDATYRTSDNSNSNIYNMTMNDRDDVYINSSPSVLKVEKIQDRIKRTQMSIQAMREL